MVDHIRDIMCDNQGGEVKKFVFRGPHYIHNLAEVLVSGVDQILPLQEK